MLSRIVVVNRPDMREEARSKLDVIAATVFIRREPLFGVVGQSSYVRDFYLKFWKNKHCDLLHTSPLEKKSHIVSYRIVWYRIV